MHISTLPTILLSLAATLAAAAPGTTISKRAPMTADQMVSNINSLTMQSQQLQPVVSSIQTGNTAIAKRQTVPFPQQFQQLLDGLSQLHRSFQDSISASSGTQPYNNDADAQKVCTAFGRFATTGTNLFKLIESKSGLLEEIFLGPVAASLRSVESVVDSFAFGVLDVVPACMETASAKKTTLDDAMEKAICAYTPGGTLGLNVFC